MEFIKSLISFLFFNYSFRIESNFDFNDTKDLIIRLFKSNKRIKEPIIEKDEFAFEYKASYFIEAFGFEGKIVESVNYTFVKIKAVAIAPIILIYFLAIVVLYVVYFTNLDNFRDQVSDFISPLYSPLILVVL